MMQKLKEIIIHVYEKYIKFHCPECGGVMDSEFYDMEIDDMVYQCRDCGKRWV